MLMKIYKFDCRSCGNLDLKRVISLGYQPFANNLLKNKKSKFSTYPLEMNFCPNCFNCPLINGTSKISHASLVLKLIHFVISA